MLRNFNYIQGQHIEHSHDLFGLDSYEPPKKETKSHMGWSDSSEYIFI